MSPPAVAIADSIEAEPPAVVNLCCYGFGLHQTVLTLGQAAAELPAASIRAGARPLPINLATALRLSDARPLIVAAAQASEQTAMAEWGRARVAWLPNLNVGASYYRHDGLTQGNSGQVVNNAKDQYLIGAGPQAIVSSADAIFAPLAARRLVRSRNFDVQAARNEALLDVSLAFFDVQDARGRLAGAEDTVEKARVLADTVEKLSSGLVAPIEADRVRTLMYSLEQSRARARAAWGTASATLTRVLRLDPSAYVEPLEPPQLQITFIGVTESVDDLIPIGLTNRPELAAQRALVDFAITRMREERLRPLMPSVVLYGAPVPTVQGGFLTGGLFGSTVNGQSQGTGGRSDINVQLLWTLENLGLGNHAAVRVRRAEREQQIIEMFRVQDTVASEIATAHVELLSAAERIPLAERGMHEAELSFRGNVKGLSETTRFGDMLVLVNRPQEAVAALQQLAAAYDNYFSAINDYNRAQFRLYHALGYPSRILAFERTQNCTVPVDPTRPVPLPTVTNHPSHSPF